MKHTTSVEPKPGDIFEFNEEFRNKNKSADGWADQRFVIIMTEFGWSLPDAAKFKQPEQETHQNVNQILARQLIRSVKGETYIYEPTFPLKQFEIGGVAEQNMIKVGRMRIPSRFKVQTARGRKGTYD